MVEIYVQDSLALCKFAIMYLIIFAQEFTLFQKKILLCNLHQHS